MATKIVVFDPLSDESVQKAEQELDQYFSDGWELRAVSGGNRAGGIPGSGSPFPVATHSSMTPPALPNYKDYVVLVFFFAD